MGTRGAGTEGGGGAELGWVGVFSAPAEASGALPLHALLPAFFVFLLGDPHLLESALGAGDDIGGQGGPEGMGGSLPHIPPVPAQPPKPSSWSPPLLPPAAASLTPTRANPFIFWGRIPSFMPVNHNVDSFIQQV